MWQYILITISAVMLFGFMITSIIRFGLLSCYSAYAPKWNIQISGSLNIWSLFTIVSALLLVPVILEQGANNSWQFLGFLAPIALTLVGLTPDYQTNKTQYVLHQIGAWCSVLFIVLYSIFIPKMLFIVAILVVIALIMGIIKPDKIMFWGELAVYLATYIILYINI